MIGAIVLLLLVLGEGLVAGALCVPRVGCVATASGGIVTTTDDRVTVSLP